MIRDALLIQKRELESKLKEKYIKRDVDFKKFNNDMIRVIVGPRRAGKSFLAMHAIKENFAYANFDDENLTDIKNYDDIIAVLSELYKTKYLFFDEIQNLSKWELFVNRLQRQGYNITLTGSNSQLLSRELASHLTGRHLIINMLPFSFKEYLAFENKELTEAEKKSKLISYLTYGGYPEPLIKNLDYKDYLSTLFDSILYKDIVKRFKIRNTQAIEELSNYLISNVANEISYRSLAKLINSKSHLTIKKYLQYLEESFIFFRLNRFSYKIKEQISSNKKIYAIDNGFIHAKAFKFSPDLGKLYENAVAIYLKKLEMDRIINFYYWKNPQQEEVDFVVKQGLEVKHLIQICYDIKNNNTKEREIRALLKAGKELNCKSLIVVTEDYETEEDVEWYGMKGIIQFIPLWKFLLKKYDDNFPEPELRPEYVKKLKKIQKGKYLKINKINNKPL